MARAALILLVLACASCGRHAAPAAPPPRFDAQWESYENLLKEDTERAKRAATAAPRVCPTAPVQDPKLNDAKQAMYDGKYQEALEKTEFVIDADSANAKAWEIRGSAFYVLQKWSQARIAWTRAYELDPCLKDIPAYLEKIKAKP